jgi:hypothetical protein
MIWPNSSWSSYVRRQAFMCTRIEDYTAAANLNKNANFEGLRVYGVLTNLTRFAFFSYDPMSNTFCRDEEIFIDTLRDGFASGMIHSLCLFPLNLRFLKAHATESQSPIRFLGLYYPHLLMGCVLQSRRTTKEMSVALLIVITTTNMLR